jgi:F-type H+-transporting ATPase subunit delta
LLSPSVPNARKRAVIQKIAAAMEIGRLVRNFLFVLIDHRRVGILSEIMDEAAVILDARLGFLRADVVSAAPLSESRRHEISTGLEQVTGKKIRLELSVDPELIGGIMARVGSTVYDGSIRGRLDALRERLIAG